MEVSREIRRRLDALAVISESPNGLTRIFLSPEHACANALVLEWMAAAGMTARIDAIGNVIGRYEGDHPGLPALVLGSHLDTVRDAGKYDGMLGVVSAIACVEALARAGERLPFAVEVIGFADEEGVRFGAGLTGSRAVAGTLDLAVLERTDARGMTMGEALRVFGLDPSSVATAAKRRDEVLAFVELHIEQGPVLEANSLPVGCVTAISGASRFEVEVSGRAGHAGTVPMASRRDALAAAAECVLAVEARAQREPGIVATVGRIDVAPGATNVIPGRARFTIDLRSPEDAAREQASKEMLAEMAAIGARRGVGIIARPMHVQPAARCAPWLMAQIDEAIRAEGIAPLRLPSGAGHDGMSLTGLADIGMIFVRCAQGVSHSPEEAVSDEDISVGVRVLLRFLRAFRAGPRP